jgi:UPF0271 protein
MVSRSVDLNADLGEGLPTDDALLEVVTSASIACGFHAGGPDLMVRVARSAATRGVTVGAHPSYCDREGFGRTDIDLPPETLVATVAYQVGAMRAAAAVAGTTLRFVKPHGALYNRAAVDPAVAAAVVEALGVAGEGMLAVLCPAGSTLAQRAEAEGLPAFFEAFADRAYRPDGTLLSRSEPGSVLTDPVAVGQQAVNLVTQGTVVASDGSTVELSADSICVHGDTPDAVALARVVRNVLEEAGLRVEPFLEA